MKMEVPALKDLQAVTSELNVLYVEDEQMLREGLVGSLSKLFKTVEVAEDGAIGLELFRHGEFDLIITDISMPNMNGIEMIQAIKEINSIVPIIVTSAHNESDKLLELINLGVDRFLTKPINKIAMLDALYKLCSGIAAARQAETYKLELEQKVRILETKMKKEYVRAKQEAPAAKKEAVPENGETVVTDDYFETLDPDHLDELVELNEELDSDVLLAFQNDNINAEYVYRLSAHIRRYGNILYSYHVFLNIGSSLSELSSELERNIDSFINNITVLRDLLESFNFTLINFRENVWEHKNKNPNFYDPSILSDVIMIINILEQKEVVSDIEFF